MEQLTADLAVAQQSLGLALANIAELAGAKDSLATELAAVQEQVHRGMIAMACVMSWALPR
jgi:hypothetical protein